jgi:hypothetical protein
MSKLAPIAKNLLYALEVYERELAGKRAAEDHIPFLKEVISKLGQLGGEEQKIESTALDQYSDSGKQARTLAKWIDQFNRFVSDRESDILDLIENHSERPFRLPIIQSHQGGSHSPTLYTIGYVDVISANEDPIFKSEKGKDERETATDTHHTPMIVQHISAKSNESADAIFATESVEKGSTPRVRISRNSNDPLFQQVRFKLKDLKRAPWYIKIAMPYFKNKKARLTFLAGISITYVVVIGSWIAILEAGNLVIFVIAILATYPIILSTIHKYFQLLKNKHILISDLFAPLSVVCTVEQLEMDNDYGVSEKIYYLSAKIYVADCPICKYIHGVSDTILLEKPFFGGKIYGSCFQNPKQHRYSFDKDLKTGVKL